MLHIGCHLSSTKGFAAMGRQALELGADTFQFFTRNPRGSRAKDIDPADAAALRELLTTHRFAPLVAHAPYTYNPASKDENIRQYTKEAMAEELRFLEALPGSLYNFHPGCHVGQGMETGIVLIADLLNAIVLPDQSTTVLLETMAGKGTEIGGKFEEIRAIIDLVRPEIRHKIGVCLDTCHVFDGGYDIVNDLDGVLSFVQKGGTLLTTWAHLSFATRLDDIQNHRFKYLYHPLTEALTDEKPIFEDRLYQGQALSVAVNLPNDIKQTKRSKKSCARG